MIFYKFQIGDRVKLKASLSNPGLPDTWDIGTVVNTSPITSVHIQRPIEIAWDMFKPLCNYRGNELILERNAIDKLESIL